MQTAVSEQLGAVLAAIDAAAAADYRQHLDQLVNNVNQRFDQLGTVHELIGHNPISVIYTNNRTHGAFLLAEFRGGSTQTLLDRVIWSYRTYIGGGFAPGYFPLKLALWQDAIACYLQPRNVRLIDPLYQTLRDNHHEWLNRACCPPTATPPNTASLPYFQRYLAALLKPDLQGALQVIHEFIREPGAIPICWEHIIQPAMYEIGRLWAYGQITIGQEYLATSITQQAMATCYPLILGTVRNKGTVVATTAPGESHQVGARMLSDILELAGWDVCLRGPFTNPHHLCDLILECGAQIVCISTALEVNLPATNGLISQLRRLLPDRPVHIMVGGQAFLAQPEAWRWVGADSFFRTASEAARYLGCQHDQQGQPHPPAIARPV